MTINPELFEQRRSENTFADGLGLGLPRRKKFDKIIRDRAMQAGCPIPEHLLFSRGPREGLVIEAAHQSASSPGDSRTNL